MDLVVATVQMYLAAARGAAVAFVRSAWALGWLLVCFPVLAILGTLVSPLGFAGGFVIAIAQAACAGTYLASLQDALTMRRPMRFDALRANLGRYTWDILNVLFPIFVVELVVRLGQSELLSLIAGLAVFLFMNPVPELIGRSRAGGLEALQEALRFMNDNGVEWLIAQIPSTVLIYFLLGGDVFGALTMFGPRMGFVYAGGTALGAFDGSPTSIVRALAVVGVVHLTMLFRGALYGEMSGGGRRQREWRRRLG